MNRIIGFPPIAAPQCRVLILGSMPGEASLAAGEYYAHPRNAFWPILGGLLGFAPEAPYPDRVRHLLSRGMAVWDVLKSCERAGSLDSSIQPDSMQVNDFTEFFGFFPLIRLVCFNGTTAETLFRKRAAPNLGPVLDGIGMVRLPSTSPAHASLSLARKSAIWGKALMPFLAGP